MTAHQTPREQVDAMPRLPWLRLGRLLPAPLRTRVFEPAYYDLLAGHAAARPGARRFGVRVLVLALETYRVGAPRLAWDVVRSSRRAWLILGLALAVIVIVLLIKSGTAPAGAPYSYPAQ